MIMIIKSIRERNMFLIKKKIGIAQLGKVKQGLYCFYHQMERSGIKEIIKAIKII
ncbi:hypothetical protein GCM10008983_27700 [Lentibacillus halophilus]|uniref:Uncharacterized protein n=1 Tax=Lentibacillus halophilus TaxID=295065 RepID=A0ABN0ZHM6_9BACI